MGEVLIYIKRNLTSKSHMDKTHLPQHLREQSRKRWEDAGTSTEAEA